MTAPATTATVDTDVHCSPAALGDLTPYMDPYWRTYVQDGGLFLSPTQGGAYPRIALKEAPPATLDELRTGLLDPSGVRTALLNCTTSFHCNRNPYYEAALTKAVNDWLVDQWLSKDERLRASMVVPTLDTEAAVAEIERIGGHPGIVQVLLPVRTDVPWGNQRHHPLLKAAAEHGLVVGLHAWGRIGNAATPTGITHTYLEDYLGNSQMIAQAHLTSLVTEGVFARVPDLRVAFVECGFSWLTTLLWRFDKDWKGVWREVPWLDGRPSEVVRRHIRLTRPGAGPRGPRPARRRVDAPVVERSPPRAR
jgi:predicted TIM-barrel fold metal-dependent hydrolase